MFLRKMLEKLFIYIKNEMFGISNFRTNNFGEESF